MSVPDDIVLPHGLESQPVLHVTGLGRSPVAGIRVDGVNPRAIGFDLKLARFVVASAGTTFGFQLGKLQFQPLLAFFEVGVEETVDF